MMNTDQACAEAARELKGAQAIVIGASNGLSISEGFNLFADDEWFCENFGDFRARFGIHSVLEGASYPFPTDEEYWGFWSRLINLKTYGDPVSAAMRTLSSIVGDRPCSIVTTNAEGHFQLAGFDPTRLFEMEGSFTELDCSAGCGAAPVSSERAVHEMAAREEGCRVPNKYHPKCERCGAPMRVNMADGNSFFKTAEWTGKLAAFKDFLATHVNDRSVILELGVGMRNPLVTGALVEAKQTLRDASVIVMNKGGGTGLRPDGALCIDDDITRALQEIEQGMKR